MKCQPFYCRQLPWPKQFPFLEYMYYRHFYRHLLQTHPDLIYDGHFQPHLNHGLLNIWTELLYLTFPHEADLLILIMSHKLTQYLYFKKIPC